MSQIAHGDLESANNEDSDQTWSTPNKPSQPSGGASRFGDSSGSLFSIYSKAAEEEDNKMVERWQKDADGILIFMSPLTGLFSATVAALFAITVQDLRPNSQDISLFYLGNIYQVLADPNATHTSLPPPVLKPPPFSPLRYAIWVNSLWFLSLVMSLSCALLATSLHQWAHRYLCVTQPARCSPEKRARMRAFFADGLNKMHVPWAVEGLPTLLHLLLFLFFGGLVIFLFHVDREVFHSIAWWIGLFSMVYVSITLLPLIWHDSPYYAPLSTPAWFLYASIPYVTFKTLSSIATACHHGYLRTWEHCNQACMRWENLTDHYRRRMLGGVERAAEETASERLSEIDIWIFDWTISALGDNISLEKFFEAIPGFVKSDLVHNFREHLSNDLLDRLSVAVHGFLGRTWSSNLVSDSEKLRRLDIATSAVNLIRVSDLSSILGNILFGYWEPQSVEMGHTLACWCTSNDHYTALYARSIIGGILGSTRERNDSWFRLAAQLSSSLAEHDRHDLRIDGSDSVLLAILIQLTRQNSSGDVVCVVLKSLCKLDISKTLLRLQHDFYTLWNEIAQEARKQGPSTPPVHILKRIRHLYIALHQGTAAASTAFSASTDYFDPILWQPPLYPFCMIASHHPDSTAHLFVSLHTQPGNSTNTVSQQAKQVNNVIEPLLPSNPTTTSKIRVTSWDLSAIPHTFPIYSGPPLTFAFSPAPDVCNDSLRNSHNQNQTMPLEVIHPQTKSLLSAPSPLDTTSNFLEHEGD